MAPASVTRPVRPEIQALRAGAVAMVVVYHLWPRALPGGYVGVDVFFCISGYLITSHLLREADRSGRVSVPAFWARRARRILPAALVTLLVCVIATVLLVPMIHRATFLADVRASTLYFQNWHLAATAVDYLHAEDAPSVVRHFWSLSAEEQFYLAWPILIATALTASAGRPTHVRRRSIAAVLGTVTLVSLAWSIQLTAADPVPAFFNTPARAWEFGAGGMLALVPTAPRRSERMRSAVAWAGLAAIAVAAVAYSTGTPFPGSAALIPVAGALAVMWAGTPSPRWSPTRALDRRPVQFLGDVSYSVYLWHWPLIVIAPFVIGGTLDTTTRTVILMLTLLLAWLTKIGIEDPVRTGRHLVRLRARWTFAWAAAATGVVLGATACGTAQLQHELRVEQGATQRFLASAHSCLGAAARDPAHPCRNAVRGFTVVPTPLEAERAAGPPPCTDVVRRAAPQVCGFGVPRSRARATIALVGDSHALHLRPALDVVARARRWRGLSIYQTACPFSGATPGGPEPGRSACLRWNQAVLRWFHHHPEVQLVVVSAHRGAHVVIPPGQTQTAVKVQGFARAWNALPATVKHIVVVRDVPYNAPSTLDCVQRALARHRRPGLACALPRSVYLHPDPAAEAVHRGLSRRAKLVDLTRFMCGSRSCWPVIGGVLVREDIGHLTPLFARTLGPYLLADIRRVLASG